MGETVRPPGGGGAGGEALGRSRGGFTTKIHLSADGRCRVLSMLLTAGQRADCTQFEPVMERIRVPRLGPPAHHTRQRERRQGLQQSQDPPLPVATRHPPRHPREERSGRESRTPGPGRGTPTRLRQGAVQEAQHCGTGDQQAQKLPSCVHEVRQARIRLPGHRHHRSNHHLAPDMIGGTEPRPTQQPCPGQSRLDQFVVGPGVSLSDAQWARNEPLLPDRTPKRGGSMARSPGGDRRDRLQDPDRYSAGASAGANPFEKLFETVAPCTA